MIPYLVI